MPLLISPVLNAAYKLQKTLGNVNLSQVMTSDCGARQSQICVNASTDILHTERDCTYTLISVPQQKLKRSKKPKMDLMFIFQLNSDKSITLPLKVGLSLIFSGLFLTHYQHYPNHQGNNDEPCYNGASYGNTKLLSHLHCSFTRNGNT